MTTDNEEYGHWSTAPLALKARYKELQEALAKIQVLELQISEWKPIIEAARTLIEAEKKSDNAGLRFGMDCLLEDLRKAVDGCSEKRIEEGGGK